MRQITRYMAVGMANTGIGYAVILAGLAAGLRDYPANALGFGAGLCFSFVANRRFTFERTGRIKAHEVAQFLICFAVSYSANLAVITFGHTLGLERNPLIQLAGVALYSVLFFVMMRSTVVVAPPPNFATSWHIWPARWRRRMKAQEDHQPAESNPDRASNATAEFDRYASEYRQQHAASTSMIGEPVEFFAYYKIDLLAEVWRKTGRMPETILDFGTGIGNSLESIHAAFAEANIVALDVSRACLEQVETLALPRVSTLAYDGKIVPLPDASVDCVFTACVFHHIPELQHLASLKEIRRILKPGGHFVLFEHNPLNPLTRLAVARCPFDEDAILIDGREMQRRFRAAGFADVSLRYCLFFPRPFGFLRPLEHYMGWLPAGAQYYLTAR